MTIKQQVIIEIGHVNDKMKRLASNNTTFNTTMQLLSQSSDYSYHIAVSVSRDTDCWYSANNKKLFKTWAECLAWVEGYRFLLNLQYGY